MGRGQEQVIATLVRRLRVERGYSLIEMLTVMSIMGVVMTGLTTLFVQGSNAELDMNKRFQAQQEARVALDKLRREIHCAKAASTSPGNGAASSVTLDLPGQCPTAVGGALTSVTWCTVSVGTTRYALYRKVATTCDNTGLKWADFVTLQNAFDYKTQSTASLSKLRVQLTVDAKPSDTTPGYSLCDQMVLRNSSRTTPDPTIRGYQDTAEPAAC
jgi:prepilin-type N-terminal cleavage/methylation domain-containing protein